ncbi:hypothetical protein SLE2022_258980 [Rubroshorea leprosula]
MELRLKCLESKQTFAIQLPPDCTLLQLQQSLSLLLSPPPPSPSSLRFSLNSRDQLLSPSSPDVSLDSLGFTTGGLLYFSLNPNAFFHNPQPLTLVQESPPTHEPVTGRQIQEEHMLKTTNFGINFPNQETPVSGLSQKLDLGSNYGQISQGTHMQGMNCPNQQTPLQDLAVQESLSEEFSHETRETAYGTVVGAETMDIDGTSGIKKFSEPYFLRRLLREELGNDGGNHKPLVIAVHAVLLESGFVAFDSVSGMPVDRFHLAVERPSSAFTVSLWYSLPELLTSSNSGSKMTDYVVIRFQNLGHFINVYGRLAKGGLVYRVCLDECRFAPTLDSIWANYDDKNVKMDEDVYSKSFPENEVFKFWRIVKEGLALPSMIDLCESTGLAPPACLMRLPPELKLKILELLSGVDVARMGCVCTGMQHLASNNDLWKQKFTEEFWDETAAQGMVNWRDKFATYWLRRKLAAPEISMCPYHAVGSTIHFPFGGDSYPLGYPILPNVPCHTNPFGVLPVITCGCGDYINDLFPGPAVTSALAQTGPAAFAPFGQQTFWPHCKLGGRHFFL